MAQSGRPPVCMSRLTAESASLTQRGAGVSNSHVFRVRQMGAISEEAVGTVAQTRPNGSSYHPALGNVGHAERRAQALPVPK